MLYGAPGELPEIGDVTAVAGAALVEVSTSEVPEMGDWHSFHVPIESVRCGCGRRGSRRATGALDVVIEPGQAFGTGAHATTRLTLELLVELTPAGPIADWGCGSGVLAIAAAKLGWGPVLACDIEAESVAATRGGARGQRRDAWRSRAATCARAARRRRPCSPTSSGRCCCEVAASMSASPERMIISGLELGRGRRGAGRVRAAHGLAQRAPRGRRLGAIARAGQARVISLDDVQAAARRLDGVAHRTPVLTSRALDEAIGAPCC